MNFRNAFIRFPILFLAACTYNKPSSRAFLESSLVYQETQYSLIVDQDTSISPSGTPKDTSECTINPALPVGLTLTPLCQITGRPSSDSPLQSYQVTARSINSTQTFTLWIEVQPSLPFDGFSYPLAEYSIVGPREGSAITPTYVSGKPQQCFAQPNLPLTLKLNPDCSITGSAFQKFEKRKYIITGVGNNKSFTTNINLEIDIRGITTDLAWYFDANLPSLQKIHSRTCDSNDTSNWLWENLALNSITSGKLERASSAEAETPCSNTSGWYGNGQPENPYRWRSDGDVLFIDQDNQNFTDFSFSFWARALSDEVSFISSYEIYYGNHSRYDLDFAADSNEVLFEIFSKKTPLSEFNDGLSFPGLFIYDNYPQTGDPNYISTIGALAKATSWYPPKEEWHHYTLTQKYSTKEVKLYLDGIEILSTIMNYKPFQGGGWSPGTRPINDRESYIIGGKGISEYTQFKLFKKTLTPQQVLAECEMFKNSVYGSSCNNNVKSYFVDVHPIPTNSCVGFPVTLTNLNGTALAPGQDVIFDMDLPSGVSVSENSDCSYPKNNFTYASNQTSKEIYIISTEVGAKNLVFKPRNFSNWRTESLVTTNLPHHLSVSGPLLLNCVGKATVQISIQDSSNNLAALDTDRTGTITFTPTVGAPTNVNFNAKAGDTEVNVNVQNIYSSGTYSVDIPGIAIGASSTFSFPVCD